MKLIRKALKKTELPARVFNPTHVNRNKDLFEEAIALAGNGCVVDITAYPVADGDDAWAADVALLRYLDSDAPAENVTISSDGGGCLPEFNEQGELTKMDVGSPHCLGETLKALLDRDIDLARVLPAFTSNVASLLRLRDKGSIGVGFAADFIVLDEAHEINDVMLGGVWHVANGEQKVFGQFETEDNS